MAASTCGPWPRCTRSGRGRSWGLAHAVAFARSPSDVIVASLARLAVPWPGRAGPSAVFSVAARRRAGDARLHTGPRPGPARSRARVSTAALGPADDRVAPLLHRGAASCDLGPDESHRRAHRAGVEGAGPGRRDHPPLRRAVVQPARGTRRDGVATALRAVAEGGRLSRGSRHRAQGHQPGVALLLGLGRRHRAGDLRQQRQPRRLRPAARGRHRSQGENRHRPLLEPVQLPRIQGADRAARRRGRHHRLLRSDGGRIHERRGVSEGPVGPGEPLPARRHRLRLHRPRRSADAGVGVHAGRAPHHRGGSGVGADDHGRAAVVARRAADSREPSAGRPRRRNGRARFLSTTGSAARPGCT